MDEAAEVRAELRNYALRRCIRFYTAILLVAIVVIGAVLAPPFTGTRVRATGAVLLLVLAGVELASALVMRDIVRARDRLGGGPETALWRLAQGPMGNAVGALLYVAAAGLLFAGW